MAGKKKEQKAKKEKPLDRWTIKELREEALKIPNIQGIHGMNKEEIMDLLRAEKGIPVPEKKKSSSVRDIKAKVDELRKTRDDARGQGASKDRLNLLRRKISRLKKKTRR
ncbi:MAG: transcription termination factor Rho [Desulfomonilaceae bacterium]|nr:transcription termination factor Rho [Desulfomonilaceae bacterium]